MSSHRVESLLVIGVEMKKIEENLDKQILLAFLTLILQ